MRRFMQNSGVTRRTVPSPQARPSTDLPSSSLDVAGGFAAPRFNGDGDSHFLRSGGTTDSGAGLSRGSPSEGETLWDGVRGLKSGTRSSTAGFPTPGSFAGNRPDVNSASISLLGQSGNSAGVYLGNPIAGVFDPLNVMPDPTREPVNPVVGVRTRDESRRPGLAEVQGTLVPPSALSRYRPSDSFNAAGISRPIDPPILESLMPSRSRVESAPLVIEKPKRSF